MHAKTFKAILELLNVHPIGKVSEEVDATVGEYNPEGERKKSTPRRLKIGHGSWSYGGSS